MPGDISHYFSSCRQVLLGQGAAAEVDDQEQWNALHCAAKVTPNFFSVTQFHDREAFSKWWSFLPMLVRQPLKRPQLARPPSGMPVSISTRAVLSSYLGTYYLYYSVLINVSLKRHPHDTYDLLEDEKFVYHLMKLAKVSIIVLW